MNLIKEGAVVKDVKSLIGQGGNREIAKYDYFYNLDKLTELTLFAKIIKINNPSNLSISTSLNSGTNGMDRIPASDIDRGYTIIKYNSNHKGKNSIWFYADNDSGVEVQVCDLILLEGDHTGRSYEYFEGIQGSGNLTKDNRYVIDIEIANGNKNLALNTINESKQTGNNIENQTDRMYTLDTDSINNSKNKKVITSFD
ncbi:hypothetical protein [Paraclostridium dentum]|uniref:hypothetical protein n=1 Tax=Paraclostridium dentum TaxID=2662455 RepID=UPI003F2A01D0